MKRLVDIVIALIALLLLSPIFLLVAYKVRQNLGSRFSFIRNAQDEMENSLK
jgi:lipopolysaccharide/colanic/teichoic acid biosynthesis glycosyltransferase